MDDAVAEHVDAFDAQPRALFDCVRRLVLGTYPDAERDRGRRRYVGAQPRREIFDEISARSVLVCDDGTGSTSALLAGSCAAHP